MRYFVFAMFLLLLILPNQSVFGALDVRLSIKNRTGTNQKTLPVRGGVPFAMGLLKECKEARIVDTAGNEYPCEIRPAAHWYDGSIKWLMVDTQVDIPSSGELYLTLKPNESPRKPSKTLNVSETADGITVETGVARFFFSKKEFGIPNAVRVDLDGDGTLDELAANGGCEFVAEIEHTPPGEPQEENWLRNASNSPRERFTAAPSGNYKVEVENANGLRVAIKLSGWLVNDSGKRLIQYTIRAYASAGSPDLRIMHTIVFAGNPKEDFIRALWIRFPESKYDSYEFGGEKPHKGRIAAEGSISLTEIGPEKIYHLAPYTQDKTVHYSLLRNGCEVTQGKEAEGWVRASGDKSAVNIAMRNFWQMHPKEIRCDSKGVSVYIWPETGAKVLDLRRRYDYVEDVYHYDLSMWPYGGEGVGITHEMLLQYGNKDQNAGSDMVKRLNNPVLLECMPEYYQASGVFGPYSLADSASYSRFEGLLNVDLEWLRHNQRTFHWDGMIDYGDNLFHGYATPSHYGYIAEDGWCSRGYVGWQCNDGTLTQAIFMQYLRTGDYETFKTAEAMCRHVTEIDTCHYCAEEPLAVGGGHRHDQQHWGNGVRGYGTATHGAITYYLLTGDERTFDVMKEYTEYHYKKITEENEDRIGGLIRMWEITGEKRLKERVDQILKEELSVPSGKPWPFATGAHFRFVSNTSVSLLYYLYSTAPEDNAALRDAIIKAADSLEITARSTWGQISYLPTIICALAYQLTGESKYLDTLSALLQRMHIPKDIQVSHNLLANMRAMTFEGMLETAKVWNVNNLYTATIHDLVPLPYVLAALRQGGRSEASVWELQRIEIVPEPFEEALRKNAINADSGFCYTADLVNGAPSDEGGGHSELILLENGVPLEPAHAPHVDIRAYGGGRWSHWGASRIYFSTSDNTDPRTNGREYKVVLE